MLKENNSGMTTVEMIVVISLIALMMAIVIPTLNNAIKNQKKDLYNVQIENIKKGAIAWGSANLYLLPADEGDSISVMLGELKSKGYVEKDITNPKTEQKFADNVLVVVTKKNNTYLYNVENISNSDQTFDKDAPYIILNGSATEYTEINGTYVEKGVQARDKDGNQITSITTFTKKNGKTESISTSSAGTYIITYVATDISNGKSSSVNRNVIVRDTIAPILMVNGINANQTMIVKKDSTFSNPTAVVDDNSDQNITPTIKGTVNTSVEGSYDLTYEAKDKNSNIGRLVLTILVKSIVNNIYINYSASTSLWTNQDVTMTIAPVNDTPLASQAYSFDGGLTWQSGASKAFSSNQTVRMQARDRYQLKSDVVSYNITNIDKNLPSCNITDNPTNWADSATLTVTGSDSESGLDGIMLPGGSDYLSVSSTTFNVTTNGQYTASVKDGAGNTNTCSVNVTKIDDASPTCTITGNPTSWVTSATLTITGGDTQSGVVGIKKPGDSDYIATTSTTFNVASNGTYTAYVKDAVDRIGTCDVNVTKIDTTSPSTPTVSLKLDTTGGSAYTSGTWTNHTVVQIPSSTDADSGINKYQYSNDTTTWYDMSNPRSITTGENLTYYVRAIDNVGNVSNNSTSHSIKVDKSAPTCTSSGGNASWVKTDLTLTGTCSDTGDSGCVGNATKTYSTFTNSTTESPGNVSDNAGNSVTCPADQTVKVDKTVPVLTTPAAITLADNQVAAFNNMTGASATDNSGITPTISVSGTVSPTAGTYTLTYTATDSATNTATGTRTVTVIASVYTFAYTGASQTFNVPLTGNYLIQVWGAEGGSSTVSGTIGGKGGYATGYKSLTSGTSIYIYVGGAGAITGTTAVSQAGGFNGGGSAYGNTTSTYRCGTGGGATDVRSGGTALSNRIIVAGGGGGSGGRYTNYYGGAGGGTSGIAAAGSGGAGGTSSAGGSSGGASGTGGNGAITSRGGGGGGYYGGGAAATNYYGGGGGSSYTGGVTSGSTTAGNASMPNPSGGTMTGRTGSGYAKLTIQP